MPVQLTKQQAEKMGLGAAEKPATPRKRKSRGVGIPRAGRAETTGLSTMIKLGWSVQSPDSIRYRLFVLGRPDLDTGLLSSELAACRAAKALEKLR